MQSGVQSADRPVSISVAVMTHNETREFKWLMRALEPARSIIDEIVVVDDFSDEGFIETVRSFGKTWPIRFFQRRLNKNFAAQRNFAKARCRGRLILFPDADELPSERVLMGLPQLLEWMESHDVDACYLPRLNVLVPGSDMADPRFEDAFTVWSNDQVEARYLVHPEYMERLVAVEQAFAGDNLRALFREGQLLIVLESGNMFESGSLDAEDDRRLLERTIAQFAALADLAAQLNERERPGFS